MSERKIGAQKFRDWLKQNQIGVTTGYALIKAGKLKVVKLGRASYILNTESDRFLASLPAFKSAA